jgi:hypothetical protein
MTGTGLLWCLTLLLLLQQHAAQQVRAVALLGMLDRTLPMQQHIPQSVLALVQAPAPSPADKAQPGDGQSSAVEDGMGWGSVLIAGRVLQQQASCTDRDGLAAVNMTVQDVPEAFASAAVTCKFVPWRFMDGLANATDQVRCLNSRPCHLPATTCS